MTTTKDDYKHLLNDHTKCYEIDTSGSASEHELGDLARHLGYASLTSLLNDWNRWSDTVAEVAEDLLSKLEEPIKWSNVATSFGNVYRADFKGCYLELDINKTWLHVMHEDRDGETVSYSIADGVLIYENQTIEDFTENWSDEDFSILEDSIKELK